jgi:hypothetical protein
MTSITIPAVAITLQALSLDVVRSCVIAEAAPTTPTPPVPDEGIAVLVPPTVTYENLPVVTPVDNSVTQMIGCIIDAFENPQGRLNALFPDAVAGDGVIERNTNDIWRYDGSLWINVSPDPGDTITLDAIIPPYNEIYSIVGRTRTRLNADSLAYALALLTEPNPIVTTTALAVRSAPAFIRVPLTTISLAAPAPAVTVATPFQSSLVNSLTYTGTGAALTVQTPYVDPSLIFIRDYTQSFTDIYVFDRVRGATKYWRPTDAAQPEVTDAQTLTAFGNASFTLGTSSLVNTSGETYLVWAFGGTAPAVTNTSGTIQTSVSASDVFSIATYTGNGVAGATIGHGLAVAPDAVLVKRISSGVNARGLMGGSTLGTNVNVEFGVAEAKTTNSAFIRTTSATTVALGSSSSVNGNGGVYAAYSFRSVAGKSKVGTYTGDGSGTGQFIECNFPVDFVIVKAVDTFGGYWFIFNRTFEGSGDTWTGLDQAAPYQETNVMYGIEGTGFRVFVGDGGDLYDDLNASGETYFYMAFAAVRPSAYVNTTTDIALAAPVPSVTAN